MRPDFCAVCDGTVLPSRALRFETRLHCSPTCLAVSIDEFMEARNVPTSTVPELLAHPDVRG